jgi:hypothetical protein
MGSKGLASTRNFQRKTDVYELNLSGYFMKPALGRYDGCCFLQQSGGCFLVFSKGVWYGAKRNMQGFFCKE